MSNARDLADFATVAPQITGKNLVINGGYDLWQRGTSQTSSGYGSADRWANSQLGASTKTASRQTFALGQTDVPGNPKYYMRTVATTGSTAASGVYTIQKLEGVARTAGREITLSFYAKADASKNIATEFAQAFGSGGSPSAAVFGTSVTTHALTTSWQRFTVTATIPSVSGKTLGTNNDDHFQLYFWFEAGSNFNSRTNSLGNQSGTFDIANVQLEFGDTATDFEQLPMSTIIEQCQRYYYKSYGLTTNPGTITSNGALECIIATPNTFLVDLCESFPTRMRATPSMTWYSTSTGTINRVRNGTTSADLTVSTSNNGQGETNTGFPIVTTTVADANYVLAQITADAEL